MFETYTQKYKSRIEFTEKELLQLQASVREEVTPLEKYGYQVSSFLLEMFDLEKELNEDYFANKTFQELLVLNHYHYRDITPDVYGSSYANPDYTSKLFGETIGQVLSMVYASARKAVGYAYEHRPVSIMWVAEEFLAVYHTLHQLSDEVKGKWTEWTKDEANYQQLLTVIRDQRLNDLEDKLTLELQRKFDINFDTYSRHIKPENGLDKKNLLKYGIYVGDNEVRMYDFLSTLDESKLQLMADTYTEAFIRGFEKNQVDLTGKKSVNTGYMVGFEPMMQKAVENLRVYGLEPIVYYLLEGHMRPRLISTNPNKQFEYDHQFDIALILTESYIEDYMTVNRQVLEDNKELIGVQSGPALVEVFGMEPFAPVKKLNTVKVLGDNQKLYTRYTNEGLLEMQKYLPKSKYSFTINAYPVPDIGDDFEEIFNKTIEVNTLDEGMYREIHQRIIEALDQGEKVIIKGRGTNRTDLTVALSPIQDVTQETNFNNCTADVNVPVGEVFTSPQLEGTHGLLHVEEVFLHGLNYKELEIQFEDGLMSDYMCANFDDEEENRRYIFENIMGSYDTLPLGEFAIGTNTTAYTMAEQYGIHRLLPILIGEKTGPHFAVGDTCYVGSEDVATYNPDGRQIKSKDNTKSRMRLTDREQAYTFQHTDITIPYKGLGLIAVLTGDGGMIEIIRDGRFVLEGTEELNKALDELR